MGMGPAQVPGSIRTGPEPGPPFGALGTPMTQMPVVPGLGGSQFSRQPRQEKKQRREGDETWDEGHPRQGGSPEEMPEQARLISEV